MSVFAYTKYYCGNNVSIFLQQQLKLNLKQTTHIIIFRSIVIPLWPNLCTASRYLHLVTVSCINSKVQMVHNDDNASSKVFFL